MDTRKTIKVNLTEDPLENIKIMAPFLNEREQENVFIYVMGLYNGSVNNIKQEKEATDETV